MVLDAPIQDDKKPGTKPGENVATEAIGKRSPVSQSAPGNATGNPGVDSLPEVLMPPELDQQNPPGKPGLKIVIERDEDNDDDAPQAPGKGGKDLKKGDIGRIASSLNMQDGGLILQDRQKLRSAFKRILEEADEQQKTASGFDRGKFVSKREGELLDQINNKMAALLKHEAAMPPEPGEPQEAGGLTKSSFRIVNGYDETDGTVAKSYRLSHTTVDKDGKENTIDKRLFQTIFDKNGNIVKPNDFIFSKLKDGIATPKEKELIESTLQAAYRDHAELNRGTLALGPDFQAKFIGGINEKLKELKQHNPNLDLEIVQRQSTVKDATGSISRTAYAYDLRNGNKITPLVDAELDLDHRDDDIEQISNLTEQLSHNNPTKEGLTNFESTVVMAYKNGGIADVNKVVGLINNSLETKKAGSGPSAIEVATIEDKANGTITLTFQLRNGKDGQIIELCQNNFNAKREEIESVDFITDKLKDGEITALEQSLIDNAVQKAPTKELMLLGPQYFVRPEAFRDQFMQRISGRLKESKEADPSMDQLELVKDGANYQLHNLTKNEKIPLTLSPVKGPDPDLKTADWFAERLSKINPEADKDVLEQLNSTLSDIGSRYGPSEVIAAKNLINLMLRKPQAAQGETESGKQTASSRASSSWMLKEGVIPKGNPGNQSSMKTMFIFDLYNSQTKQTIKGAVKVEIGSESDPVA